MNRIHFLIISGVAIVNIVLFAFFYSDVTAEFSMDSFHYMETAKLLKGDHVERIFGERLLKPVVPILAGMLSYIMPLAAAFVTINSLLYFVIGFVVYLIAKLIFKNDLQALLAALLYITAYPILEYGMVVLTDMAGWLFFVITVYLSLLFLDSPGYYRAALIGIVAAIGLLAKESGGMGIIFFGLAVIFLCEGNIKTKFGYILTAGLSLLIPFSLWQIYVYNNFNYSYLDWYLYNRSVVELYIAQIIKSIGATFLVGWFFAIYGAVKIYSNIEIRNRLLILLVPSLTFFLWYFAVSRLYFIMGLLLALLASFGIIELARKHGHKWIWISMTFILCGNYFWLLFDESLRHLVIGLFNTLK